ncbi:MAG: flagellar motor stator protein MotA [candidate division Zixibacteria bacterium]|nr:flagellar motor stator protein MotA [candidate division Zixibacteria bacterium]
MVSVFGLVIVIVAVIGGFMMEGGKILVLNQPAEFVIIGGAMIGSLLAATSLSNLKRMIGQLKDVISPSMSKKQYLDIMVMLFELFNVARKDGLIALEKHVETPNESSVFSKYKGFMNDHHAVHFLCDTLRMVITGTAQTHELEDLMEVDMEAHHEEINAAPTIIQKVGDSLPGFGIVAAVLGVVLTMGSIDKPPEVIGHKVGAALVGTFLGILLAYGFVLPISTNMEFANKNKTKLYECMKQAILAFQKGIAGVMAVEFARRTLPNEVRPSFQELEEACNKTRAG